MTSPKSRRMRRPLWIVFFVVIFGGLLGMAVVGGYYIHAWQTTPLAKILPKVEKKIGQLRGLPSQLEQDVALLETTFVQLRGKVMRPPGIGWINGGAMTVRGQDLIIMDREGRMFTTDGDQPITKLSGVQAPDSGLADYVAFSQTPEGKLYTHNTVRVRFNDITWVSSPGLSGLALSYTFYDADRKCHGTQVSWAPVDADTDLADLRIGAQDWTIIFETTPCLALNTGRNAIEGLLAGGRMAFKAPGKLYLGSGDYHLDGIHTYDIGIQSDDTSYGKVIEIDLTTGENRIYSKGHRNLQGIAIDGSGQIWVTEHGIRGGDELNLVREGENYGWPLETLGTLYSGQPVPNIPFGRHDTYTAPTFAWLPSAAVSSLTILDDFHPSWDGDLLAGSLSSAAFGQSLWHIRTTGERVIFAERIRLGHRVRYLTQFGDRLAVWLDSNDLVLFDVTQRVDPLERVKQYVSQNFDASTTQQVSGILAACNECHSFAERENRTGPSLNGVVGRAIGGTEFPEYSDALRATSGTWTKERLKAYLAGAQENIPGTSMPDTGLTPGPVLDALVDALESLDSDAEPDLTYN